MYCLYSHENVDSFGWPLTEHIGPAVFYLTCMNDMYCLSVGIVKYFNNVGTLLSK